MRKQPTPTTRDATPTPFESSDIVLLGVVGRRGRGATPGRPRAVRGGQLQKPDGDPDQREVRRERRGCGEAEDVREPEARRQLGAGAGDPEQRQEGDADDEVQDVREEQPGERARQRRARATK